MNRMRNGYKATGKGSATIISLDKVSPSYRDRLLRQAFDFKAEINEIEELMLPEFLHPKASTYRECPQDIREKVDKLFEANKFQKQKQVMQMYFGHGLTSTKIAEITGQDDRNVRRSITMGLEKIKKKLTAEEWNQVKWYYNIKSNDSLRSTSNGRFKSQKELAEYTKSVQQPSEVKSGRLVNGVVVFD